MNLKINYRQIIKGSSIAVLCGAVFNLIIPVIVLFAFDILFTFAAVFDPLHAGSKINDVWNVFIYIIIIQAIVTFLASILSGGSIYFITEKIKNGWVYLLGTGASVGIFAFFQFVAIITVSLFAHKLVFVSWLVISFVAVGFSSVLIGLIIISVYKKIT